MCPKRDPLTSSFALMWLESHGMTLSASYIPVSLLKRALILDDGRKCVYANHKLLPPAKRIKAADDASEQEVLAAKNISEQDYLPTLCASYTPQHLLHKEHWQTRGLFAGLKTDGYNFTFVDPFVFLSMFGATGTIVLPKDLNLAFHRVGNAILQIHGLVALLFATQGVSGDALPKLALVRQCWSERLTSLSAVVRTQDGWLLLQPILPDSICR